MSSTNPKVITTSEPTRLAIEWADGHTTEFTAPQLRAMCACANCVDEVSGKRMHDPNTVPHDLTQNHAHLVGNYALSMTFSDGHHTGIYTFRMLRDSDPAAPAEGG